MTIKDIARLSGYSVATVSRVLNAHPDVSEDARDRVLAVVAEHGFEPNANAKRLKQQSDAGVAILVKGTMNQLFADLVERLQDHLRDAAQSASVYYLDEDANEVAYACQLCREHKPRGILFLGGDLEQFRRGFSPITVPCVLLTNSAKDLGFENLSSFTTDDESAAGQVIDMLAAQGHRRIGVVGGNFSCSQIGYRRLVGCREAMRRWQIPFDESVQYEPCRYSMADAYCAAQRLLKRCGGLTAIFAVSDVMAVGVVRALHDMGRRVPEDISIVGYDGIAMGQYTVPRLATVRQDVRMLAERGANDLLRRMSWNGAPVHELVPFTLIPGESVRAIHSGSAHSTGGPDRQADFAARTDEKAAARACPAVASEVSLQFITHKAQV